MESFNLNDAQPSGLPDVKAFQTQIKQQYLHFFAQQAKELFATQPLLTSFSWRQIVDYDDENYSFSIDGFCVNGLIVEGVYGIHSILNAKRKDFKLYTPIVSEKEEDDAMDDEDEIDESEDTSKHEHLMPTVHAVLAVFANLYNETKAGSQNLFRSAFGVGVEIFVTPTEIRLEKYDSYYDEDDEYA